jgi:hypothetical protein
MKKYNRKDWGGALTGASSGFQIGSSIGSMFGPLGAGIASGAGALLGALTGNRSENKQLREQNRRNALLRSEMINSRNRLNKLNTKQTYLNDLNYLSDFQLNNMNSLFMKSGGAVQEPTIKPPKAVTIVRNNVWRPHTRLSIYPELVKRGVIDSTKVTQTLWNTMTPEETLNYIDKNKGIDVTHGRTANPGGLKYWAMEEHVNNPHYKPSSKHYFAMKKLKANGGQIAAKGIGLGNGNKILTNSSGTTTGTHESGQNLPIKKKGRVLAYAEPGEVLVTDRDMPYTPFVLSKRIGVNGNSFADQFIKLDRMKNRMNKSIIEAKQAKLIGLNNKMAPMAYNGINLGPMKVDTSGLQLFKTPGLQKTNNPYTGASTTRSKSFNLPNIRNLDVNTIFGAAGTIGNLLMSNKILGRQKNLITDSLNQTLSYTPRLSKNYLLNENVDVSDNVSAVNQGYASAISGLSGIDPAIASALRNSANMSRIGNLNQIYGEKNRIGIGLRNQNTMGIMQNNMNNLNTLNQTELMKLNAKIAANEQFGDLESTRLGNVQGAVSEFNTILRDRDMMDSLKARWKDSIGTDFVRARGGRIRKSIKYTY